MPPKLIAVMLLALVVDRPACAQTQPRSIHPETQGVASAGERRASAAFEAARKSGPLALHAFLEKMPKGADLHMHLSGAVYAETLLKDAANEDLCVDPRQLSLIPKAGKADPADACPDGDVAAKKVVPPLNSAGQKLYNDLIDAMSMRTFVPVTGTDGHDHFFASFDHFPWLSKDHAGEWLDELATRAAAQNEQYLEVMQTPAFKHAAGLGYQIGWLTALKPATPSDSSVPDDTSGTSPAELSALRDRLLVGGLRDEVAIDNAQLADGLKERDRLEQCGSAAAAPACKVQIKFLYQVLRAFPPQQVFAQTLLGFEVASANPDVVGINFVQPEDAYLAMTEYHRQMLMLDYLHSVYPKVHISLHAGELAPGLVAPAGLRFHIREAVELGHAERIGHGVDVMLEDDPEALLKEMAKKHIMVEINLSSNDGILGITPPNHPFPYYRGAHVPASLSTDDEGVSRIDLTHEYVRVVTEYGLDYRDLKNMARTGMEHTFLSGADLWAEPGAFARMAGGCSAIHMSDACSAFLKASPHADQQMELERRFAAFESQAK